MTGIYDESSRDEKVPIATLIYKNVEIFFILFYNSI